MTNKTNSVIPGHLMQDRRWRGTLHLFLNHPKLQMVFTTRYFNLDAGLIKITALKKVAAPWSESEKFALKLALHLYDESNKFNLSDMDYLDDNNRRIAMEAIRMRFP